MDTCEKRRKILQVLQARARLTAEQIGDRLQLPAAEVAALIEAMEADGTLLGYRALVRPEAAGNGEVRAIIEVEVQPEREGGFDRVARAIARFDEVRDVYLVSGRYDLRLEVVGDSLQEVALFVASKLASIQGVKGTATYFLLKKYKEAGFVLEKGEEYERLKVSA
ncbi:MAG: Leucine-responsive regulatory protein [Lentisphaerae bacterium ADurb.BinA184]|nr:MAG: Leucine-responsive regulatory protein [Lentisphaerae bacterium ADurb.BinA184]